MTVDQFNEFFRHIATPVAKVKKRIADHMSMYPDPSDLKIVAVGSNSALDVVLDIVALEACLPGTRTRHQTYDQRERAARMAQKARLQGQWTIVRTLILTKPGLWNQVSVLFDNFSPEDIFGNLVPRLRRRISSMRPVSKHIQELRSQNRRVTRRVRRRGYTDHGSLRPPHTWLPWNGYARTELGEISPVTFLAPRSYEWVGRCNGTLRLRERSDSSPIDLS